MKGNSRTQHDSFSNAVLKIHSSQDPSICPKSRHSTLTAGFDDTKYILQFHLTHPTINEATGEFVMFKLQKGEASFRGNSLFFSAASIIHALWNTESRFKLLWVVFGISC
jgi:hypothetical protein